VGARASDPLDRAGELLDRISAENAIKDELEQLAKGLTPPGRIPAAYKPRARQIRANVDQQLRAVRDAHGDRLVELACPLKRALEEYDLLTGQIQREQRSRPTAAPSVPRERHSRRPRAAPPRPSQPPASTAPLPAPLPVLPALLDATLAPFPAQRPTTVNDRQRINERISGYCQACEKTWPTAGGTITRCPDCTQPLIPTTSPPRRCLPRLADIR
jgi:hypothetical protein